MPNSNALIVLALALFPPPVACVSARAPLNAQAAQVQTAPRAPQFTPVEGADLRSKLEEAARLARSKATPFWTAYSFDVRPGVAVDPGGGEFHGSMMSSGDTHVFVGTSNGRTVETRDLAVFLLREPGRNGFTRMEVYNLARPREYAGYPVYWAGRATNEESLGFLRGLVGQGQRTDVQERAALALALHDDARVAGLLKELARSNLAEGARSTAVFWLGQTGGQIPYLADLVRDNKEPEDLRRTAAHAIGASRDQEALGTLQSLYSSSLPEDVKRGIIHAVAENENRPAAHAFLLRVAQTDPHEESRRTAVHQLAEFGTSSVEDLIRIYSSERSVDVRRAVVHALAEIESPRAQGKIEEIARGGNEPEDLRRQAIHQIAERDTEAAFDLLSSIFAADADADVRRQILHAFSEMKTPRARARLLAAARDTRENPDVRRQAIHWLAEQQTDAAVDELAKIFDADTDEDVRRQILHAFSEMQNQRAEDKLFAVASGGAGDQELRRSAIHMLGEMATERSLKMLGDTVNRSDEQTEVQVQALRAISEKPAAQSVPLLLNAARTHPNMEVRKEAIRRLGESGDPRAVEFFRELMKNK